MLEEFFYHNFNFLFIKNIHLRILDLSIVQHIITKLIFLIRHNISKFGTKLQKNFVQLTSLTFFTQNLLEFSLG